MLSLLYFFLLPTLIQAIVYADCPFENAPVIRLGGPLSFTGLQLYVYGDNQFLNGYLLFQKWLHYERKPTPGWIINGVQHCLELVFEDTESLSSNIVPITEAMIANSSVDIFLAPLSGGFISLMAPVTEAAGKILLSPFGTADSAFMSNSHAFSMIPSSYKYLEPFIRTFYFKGARTVAVIHDDTPGSYQGCAAIHDVIAGEGYDFNVIKFSSTPVVTDEAAIRSYLTGLPSEPDILIYCGGIVTTCTAITNLLHELEINVGAFISPVCPTYPEYIADLAAYTFGGAFWSPAVNYNDEVVGWTADEFAANFIAQSGVSPMVFAVTGFAALESLLVAIERAGSIDTSAVAFELARLDIETLYNNVKFDEYNMNEAAPLLIQVGKDLQIYIVSPDIHANAPLVYPMIPWSTRECMEEHGDDACQCDDNCRSCTIDDIVLSLGDCTLSNGWDVRSVHYDWNSESVCRRDFFEGDFPKNTTIDFTSRSSTGIVALSLMSFIGLMSVVSIGWIVINRESKFVIACQPHFLVTFCIGCVVLASACYSFIGNPNNSSCQWRIGLILPGVTLLFGSIWVIVYQVWKIYLNVTLRKIHVLVITGLKGLSLLLLIDFVLIIGWMSQYPPFVAKNVSTDIYNPEVHYHCSYDNPFTFVALTYKAIMIIFTCYMSYETRNVDTRYLQSSMILVTIVFLSVIWASFSLMTMTNIENQMLSIIQMFGILISCIMGLVVLILPRIAMKPENERPRDNHEQPRIPRAHVSRSEDSKEVRNPEQDTRFLNRVRRLNGIPIPPPAVTQITLQLGPPDHSGPTPLEQAANQTPLSFRSAFFGWFRNSRQVIPVIEDVEVGSQVEEDKDVANQLNNGDGVEMVGIRPHVEPQPLYTISGEVLTSSTIFPELVTISESSATATRRDSISNEISSLHVLYERHDERLDKIEGHFIQQNDKLDMIARMLRIRENLPQKSSSEVGITVHDNSAML